MLYSFSHWNIMKMYIGHYDNIHAPARILQYNIIIVISNLSRLWSIIFYSRKWCIFFQHVIFNIIYPMSALHVQVEQYKHFPACIVYVTQAKKWQNCKAKLLKYGHVRRTICETQGLPTQLFFRLFKAAKLACLANWFWSKFSLFWSKNLGNFGNVCFRSVISTNFAIFGAKFAKISTSQIWKKKHWWEWVHL